MSNTKRTITSLLGGIIAAALLLSPLQSVDAAVATASVSAVSDQVSVKGLTAAEQKRVDEIDAQLYPLYDQWADLQRAYSAANDKYKAAKKKEKKAKKGCTKVHGIIDTLTIRGKEYTVLTVENDSAERNGYSYIIPKKYNNSKYLIQSHKIAWAGHSYHYNAWIKSGDMEYVYTNDDYSRVVMGHVPYKKVNYGSAKLKKKLDKATRDVRKVSAKIKKLEDERASIVGYYE